MCFPRIVEADDLSAKPEYAEKTRIGKDDETTTATAADTASTTPPKIYGKSCLIHTHNTTFNIVYVVIRPITGANGR